MQKNNAPDVDPIGEISTMVSRINELEAHKLIKLFYEKCPNSNLKKLSINNLFWTKGNYDLEAFFNISSDKKSYLTCIMRGNNRYAYYVLNNP